VVCAKLTRSYVALCEHCCGQKTQAASAQSFALSQQATMEFTCHDHSVIAFSQHLYMGDVLLAHPVHSESHINTTPTERLQQCNSGAISGRELFKGSKDAARLVVCNEKSFSVGVCGCFMSDVVSGGLLGHPSQLHLALGPNHDYFAKFLLEFRPQYESFDTLDLLGFQIQKLWSKAAMSNPNGL